MDIQKSQWAQEFAEQQRQFNEQMAMQRAYGGGGYGGYGGYGGGGGYTAGSPADIYEAMATAGPQIAATGEGIAQSVAPWLPSTVGGAVSGVGGNWQLPQITAQQLQQAANTGGNIPLQSTVQKYLQQYYPQQAQLQAPFYPLGYQFQ